MKQNIKNRFFIPMFFIITLCFYNISFLRAGFDMGALSEEDVMAMQQALENEINNMSPAERDNFYQIMENVERMSQEDPAMLERFITGQMSKEEEAQFVGAMVPESIVQPVAPTESTTAIEKEEPKVAEVKELTQEQLSIQDMIISIIAKAESFLVKMQSYPEINSKIKSWSKNNNLTSWPTNKQWNNAEFDINLFIQKLFAIEHEKNSAKKKAFIDAIIKNDTLSASLITINNALTHYEKMVDIAPFGITKIKKETKDAMQKIINTFTDELYNNQIISSLDELLKIYETEDKKSKEEESEQIKRAQQESGKARPKEYMKSAGQEKSPSSSRGGSSYSSRYDDYDYSDYDSDYGSYPSSSYRSSSPNSYGSSSSSSPSSSGYPSSSARSGVSVRESGTDGELARSGQENRLNAKKSPSSGGTQGNQPSKKVQTEKQEVASKKKNSKEKDIFTMQNYLEKVVKILTTEDDDKKLNNIFGDLISVLKKEFTSEELNQLNDKLSYMVRYLTGGSKSVRDTLKALDIKISKEDTTVKADYKKQVEDIYNEYKGVLNKFLEQMRIIENHLGSDLKLTNNNTHYLWDSSVELTEPIDKDKKPLPVQITGAKEKLFEDKGLPVPEEKEKTKPTTFNDLKNAIEELDAEIKKFLK